MPSLKLKTAYINQRQLIFNVILKMKKVATLFLLGIIKLYQNAISPYTRPSCRYIPTCSQYAVEAIQKYGPFKGGWMAFRRILRCNPLGGNGYDPVP